MTPWLITVASLLLVGVMFLYYRSRQASDAVQAVLAENTEALKTVNDLLQVLADRANAATESDKIDAAKIITASGAADFLRGSTGPGSGPSASLRIARRGKPSNPITGFARGFGDADYQGSLRPRSLDAVGTEVA